MIDYWELAERDRAALTEADMEGYVAVELMRKGVLKVVAPTYVDEPEMPEPDLMVYVARSRSYGSQVAFKSLEVAQQAAGGGGVVALDSGYINSQTVQYASALQRDGFDVKRVYSEARYTELKPLIDKATAAKKANEEMREAYDKGREEQKRALDGMWSDWYACMSKAREMRRVVSVFEDYCKTAGDQIVAAMFLEKVFPLSKINDASEWCGVDIPNGDGDTGEADDHVVAADMEGAPL